MMQKRAAELVVSAQGPDRLPSHHQTAEGGWRGIQRICCQKIVEFIRLSSVMAGGTLKSTLILLEPE